uniref:Transmembrane protein n=1 Tax=Kalanchoe fedtschenkoi TaxID=63787 RepID=A0A7N0T374_KALFE
MGEEKGFWTFICYSIIFLPVFVFLFVLGIIKCGVFSPIVLLIIACGDAAVVIGLCPVHLVWSIYCISRTEKFGPWMKCLMVLLVPLPIVLWMAVGVVGSVVMGIGYGFVWPVTETFNAVSKEDASVQAKILHCFTDGTWSCVVGACNVVRDFADFSYHSYFSMMEGLLEPTGEAPIELKVLQIPGSIFCSILGLLVDVPLIALIVLYKAPILLFKGWHQLIRDLIGREGPFLESVCVPFAGLLILCWPFVVLLAIFAGVLSSFLIGFHAGVVAYQESSTKKGLLFIVASLSLFDEYTNDYLYLREGSCFPRPRYREVTSPTSSVNSLKGPHDQSDLASKREPLIRSLSSKARELSALLIWDDFFDACENLGRELLAAGSVTLSDLEKWRRSESKIIHVGIPAYVFLECLVRSIKSGSPGFLLRSGVELTRLNRPEGRVFDWLFEPMSVMKEQLAGLSLRDSEEAYMYRYCLYSGDAARIKADGGCPPEDEIRRAQLEGICRRLQGFCLTLSRLPTSRRRFHQVVNEVEKEAMERAPSVSDDLLASLV